MASSTPTRRSRLFGASSNGCKTSTSAYGLKPVISSRTFSTTRYSPSCWPAEARDCSLRAAAAVAQQAASLRKDDRQLAGWRSVLSRTRTVGLDRARSAWSYTGSGDAHRQLRDGDTFDQLTPKVRERCLFCEYTTAREYETGTSGRERK